MKIYMAAGDEHSVDLRINILLSFYDLTISTIPFRKKTFQIIKENQWKSKNKN